MNRSVPHPSSLALCVTLLAAVACGADRDVSAPAAPGEAVSGSAGASRDADAQPDALVAEIHGHGITVGELDAYVKEQLFARATGNGDALKLYEVRSDALAQLLDRRAVEHAAAEADLDPDAFLNQEVVPARGIPEEEVRQYYDEHESEMSGANFEQVEARIRNVLRQQRGRDLVNELREQAEAEVLLEPPRFEVASDGPARGPEHAPVTIVEFSDFQCPYCRRVVPTIEEVLERYPNRVRVVFRHLPLDRIHGRARPAAEAAACAHEQGEFWAYHDAVFANNRELSDEDLEGYAEQVGVDMEAFRACVSERRFQDVVQADAEAAETLGIRGTPAFFVNGIPMQGAKPLDEFVRLIEAELERVGPRASTG